MSTIFRLSLSILAWFSGKYLVGAFLLLMPLSARTAWADPKPLTREEQAKVDQAIDKGVEFLKKTQTRQGDFGWKMYETNLYQVGQCALPAYALLESGVPADDPVIQKAAAYLRPRIPLTKNTYDLALAILFFDRLGDSKDKQIIQACALRLLAGQYRTGGWSYSCPILNDRNALDLLNCLTDMRKRRESGATTRDQVLQRMEIPLALRSLTVFQESKNLSWQESPITTDNSNTQFALLGLWAARRHEVAVEPALEISVERFERSQAEPAGFWSYRIEGEVRGTSMSSMICVGLIGLAIGRGMNLPTPGTTIGTEKNTRVLRGLSALSRRIGNPSGDMNKRKEMEELYFLWSLERAAVLFNLPDIAGKDWYRWGAEILVVNQKKGGWWPDASSGKKIPNVTYKATICTSFALLFLKRSHPMKDLTSKLPFKARELNEGIARLRRNRPPLGTITTTPVESGYKKPR